MVFAFFRTSDVIAFANSAAEEYDRVHRSSALRHDTAAKRQERVAKLSAKIDAYCREQKLNFYRKSKLLFALKEGLQRSGIPAAEIDSLLDTLLTRGLKR